MAKAKPASGKSVVDSQIARTGPMTKVISSMTCSNDIAAWRLRGSSAKMCDHRARAIVPRLGIAPHSGNVMKSSHEGNPRIETRRVMTAQNPDQRKKGMAMRRWP